VIASPDAVRSTRATATQFGFSPISPYVAVNKDAFPSNPVHATGCANSFSLPKQAQVCCVSF
jgi:hypothetical protein